MGFHFDELGYDPDEAREGRELERRKMATARRTAAVKKSLTLVKLRETKGTVVFGPADGDPDAPAQQVYIKKSWAQGVESITITAK